MKPMRLCALPLIAILSACAGMDQSPTYPPTHPTAGYPASRSSRQPDPLTEASKQTRSVRTIISNVMGIKRDISR